MSGRQRFLIQVHEQQFGAYSTRAAKQHGRGANCTMDLGLNAQQNVRPTRALSLGIRSERKLSHVFALIFEPKIGSQVKKLAAMSS